MVTTGYAKWELEESYPTTINYGEFSGMLDNQSLAGILNQTMYQ
jgi:hypothetical protein